MVADAERFIRHLGKLIVDHPLQVYTSALLFAPADSRVKHIYWKEVPQWVAISPEMEKKNWSPWLQTIDRSDSQVEVFQRATAFSCDGNQLASVLDKGSTVKVWDATTGECLQTLALESKVAWVAFPWQDGNKTVMAVAMDAATDEGHGGRLTYRTVVRFWDAASHQWDPIRALDCATVISTAVFSPEGTWLAGADDSRIVIWDWERGDRTLSFPHRRDTPHAMAYAPSDTRLLASAHRSSVLIWNPESGAELRRVDGTANDIVAFFPDGAKLVVANNALLKTWDPRTGEHLQTLEVPSPHEYASPVALSTDGSHFAAAPRGNMRIWDVATRRRLRTLTGYHLEVRSLVMSRDGSRLASADDAGVKIWDCGPGPDASARDSEAARHHARDISAIVVSAGGTKMASVSEDAVKVWDPADGKLLWQLPSEPANGNNHGGAECVALSPDGTRLALVPVYGDKVQIWDFKTPKPIDFMPETPLAAPCFSPDGNRVAVLAASQHQIRAKLWNLSRGRGYYEPRYLHVRSSSKVLNTACLAFSPDGNSLAAALNGEITLWTQIPPEPPQPGRQPPPTPESIKHLVPQGQRTTDIISLCFSSDNNHLAASHKGGKISIWSVKLASCPGTLQVPDGKGVDLIAFTKENATTSSGTIALRCRFLTNAGVMTWTGNVVDPESAAGAGTLSVKWECRREGYGVDVSGSWITKGAEKVLLLPSENRPGCVTVVPRWTDGTPTVAAIVLGCRSGRVLSLCFRERAAA